MKFSNEQDQEVINNVQKNCEKIKSKMFDRATH